MKILNACLSNPYRSTNGISKLILGRIRALEEYDQRVDSLFFTFSTTAIKRCEIIKSSHSNGERICVRVGLLGILIWLIKRSLSSEIRNYPIQSIISLFLAEKHAKQLLEIFSEYDVVHFYHIRLAGLWKLGDRIEGRSAVVVDLIDSYSLNYSSRLTAKRDFVSKRILEYELRRIVAIESGIDSYLPERGVLMTVAEKDMDYVRSDRWRREIVPVGVDMDEESSTSEIGNEVKCVFFGNLDYEPNIDACQQINEIARCLRSRGVNNIRFTIAGRNANRYIRSLDRYENVSVVSPVKDMRELVEQHNVSLMPMVSGSGMQSKVLESIAWKRLVVATEKAAEPLDLRAGIDYIRIESIEHAVYVLQELATSELDVECYTRNASKRIEVYGWSKTARKLLSIYSQCSTE